MNAYATDGKCHNSERGTYGHECGKTAIYLGTNKNGWSCGFCNSCRWHGFEAREMVSWQAIVAKH